MSDLAIGMVGLGVMGRNLVLNIEEKGFSAAGCDAWPEPVDKLAAATARQADPGLQGPGRVRALAAQAARDHHAGQGGQVVDDDHRHDRALLSPGDVLVDGGNECFHEHRAARDAAGREGHPLLRHGRLGRRERSAPRPVDDARRRPEGYAELAPMLTKIAAQHEDGPCVTYIGPGGAGPLRKDGAQRHRVRRHAAHRRGLRRAEDARRAVQRELADVFDEWNQGELESFLIEITGAGLPRPGTPREGRPRRPDPGRDGAEGHRQVDGRRRPLELGVPVPTIADVGRRARHLRREGRPRTGLVAAARADPRRTTGRDVKQLVANVRAALYAAKACSYAQGVQHAARGSEHAMGPSPRRAGAHLAGRMHHPRAVPRTIKAAYDRDPELAQSAPRFPLPRRARALARPACGGRRRGRRGRAPRSPPCCIARRTTT